MTTASKISGVYLINCLTSRKVYVGSSVSVRARIASHRSYLRRGVHSNAHLQNAWNSYGEGSFVFELVHECSPESLSEIEQLWIDRYSAANPEFGMNNSPTAETAVGFVHSSDSKKRIAARAAARGYTDALRKANEARKGKPAHNRGKPGIKWTDEQRSAASAARKGRPAWNKGLPHSADEKARISEAVSKSKTKYKGAVVATVKELRASGSSYPSISRATGVSIAQCYRIVNGLRTYEKSIGAAK